MKYASGRIGRIFVVRFEDRDIVIREIERLCRKERIAAGVCLFIGGLRQGDMAAGPKKPVVPPEPNWVSFKDGWEAMGIATVFKGPSGPQVHIHSSMGQKKSVLTGCVRRESDVFCVLEGVFFELKGIDARKAIDPVTGLNLLTLGAR